MLTDKVIIVTGGAGLLGRAFCEAVVQNGGIAVIAELNKEIGLVVESDLNKLYGKDRAYYHKVDINSSKSIEELIETVYSKFKKVDALVNNAYPKSKNYGRHFFDVEYADFCENVNLHLGGYFLMCQKFAKYFQSQGYGNIINIASVYGFIAPRFEIYDGTKMTTPVEYAVIKSGILHLTKYLAKYLKGKNIRVNTISPGGIYDNQPEGFVEGYKSFCLSKGMLDKTDIHGTLLFLLSDYSKHIYGQNIVVDDGFSL